MAEQQPQPIPQPIPQPKHRPTYTVHTTRQGQYVVVNRITNMVVVGPFSLRGVAEAAAGKRNGGRG